MSDRDAIFSAIRSTKRAPAMSADQIAKEALDLIVDPGPIQPDFRDMGLVDRFVMKATSERVTATVDQAKDMGDVPAAVKAYLARVDRKDPVVVQSCAVLEELDWSAINRVPDLVVDGGTSVTLAEFGVAETGSVVFRSGPDSPILLNFLPLYHVVVLRASTLVGYPEDLWPHLGGAGTEQSRLLTLVTGTSGTADIEAKNVRGAHGPRFMHIILVRD